MSQTDRPKPDQNGNNDPLSALDSDLADAIQQLESLLDSQTQAELTADGNKESLPILDDVVTSQDAAHDDEFDIDDSDKPATTLPHGSNERPDPQAIRHLLDQLSTQLETELDSVVDLLKHNALREFRTELAAALKIDPQQLDSGDEDASDDPTLR